MTIRNVKTIAYLTLAVAASVTIFVKHMKLDLYTIALPTTMYVAAILSAVAGVLGAKT